MKSIYIPVLHQMSNKVVGMCRLNPDSSRHLVALLKNGISMEVHAEISSDDKLLGLRFMPMQDESR